MDIFIEQIVTKKPDIRDILSRMCLIIATLALGGFCFTMAFMFWNFPFISFVAIAAIPGVIWLGVNFLKGLILEYEYILTNKELDIDKIVGRRKRKRMITLNLMNAEKLDIYSEGLTFNADTTVSAHDNSYTNMWYLTVNHDSHGKVVLLFNPNDEFIVKLNKSLLPRVRNKKVSELIQKEDRQD